MSSKQIQQIYQYIQANGNFLGSQKILKQVEKHPQMVWQIICKLCSKLKNKNIENAYAQLVYTLSDPQKHQRSSKWLKEYMDIRDLAIKLGTGYLVMDYIRPEKDKIISLIAKIIEVAKGVHFIKNQFDEFVVKDDLMTKEYTKYKTTEEATQNALTQIVERKKSQRPLYDQKVKLIQHIHQQNNQKRQDKLEYFAKHKFFKDEIARQEKRSDELKFYDESSLLRIEQIKNQIARNAPENKKEKIAVDEEYHRLEKQIHVYLDRTKLRQNKIKSCIESRRKYKGLIIQQVNKLIEVFSLLEQSKSKFSKLKEENENQKRRKNNHLSLETDGKELLKSLETQLRNSRGSKQSLQRQKQMLQSQFRQFTAELTQVMDRVRQHDETIKKLRKIERELRAKIGNQIGTYEKEQEFLETELTKWMAMFDKNLTKMFSPVSETTAMIRSKKEFKKKFV